MNKQTINIEAAEAALNNANQIVDLALNRSVELLEKNIKATKDSIERHTGYANAASSVTSVEDFAKLQKEIADKEAKALQSFSQDVYELSNEAASDIAEVSDNNRAVTEDFVADSLEQVAKSIPNGNAQPFGSVFSDLVRNQINAYKTFNGLVQKTVSAHRENFNAVVKAVNETSKNASTGKTKKRK